MPDAATPDPPSPHTNPSSQEETKAQEPEGSRARAKDDPSWEQQGNTPTSAELQAIRETVEKGLLAKKSPPSV